MPQLRSKRNLSCVKHKAALKQALLLVKPPFSPINTGASSYRISSNSFGVDGRMTRNEFASYTYDAASRIIGITQNLWASKTVTQVIGTATTVLTQTYLIPLTWQASYDRRNRLLGFNRDGSSSGFTYDTDLDGGFDADDFGQTNREGSTQGQSVMRLERFTWS